MHPAMRARAGCQTGRMTQAHDAPGEDPYLWLEDVTGPVALDWVRARNAETVGELSGGTRFEHLRTPLREVLDPPDPTPFPVPPRPFLYNSHLSAPPPPRL